MANTTDLSELKSIFRKRKTFIPQKEIRDWLQEIDVSWQIFPQLNQKAMIIRLLHIYEHTKKKVVIQLDESELKKKPTTITMGVLAEDWAGMSNSILGIIHQREGNVLYVQGFTLPLAKYCVGIVLLAFQISSPTEYDKFLREKPLLIKLIRDASQGSRSKSLLLNEETTKFEIYNSVVRRIQTIYHGPDQVNIIGEKGEALKFFSSRSREYLEERKTSDLADFILTNYNFQKDIRAGRLDHQIKIRNFETCYERLTGITFACKEFFFSVENFLKTLEYIVPGHIIKHHKSFVTFDGILLYRIEIVDRNENPLDPIVNKSIAESIEKLIKTAVMEKFSQIKNIGGVEHYGRAIIPFLMQDMQTTKITQVYLNVEKKTEFNLEVKLIIVADNPKKDSLNRLICKLEGQPGIEINSVNPPRTYRNKIQVSILNLAISLADFPSLSSIFATIRDILKQIFGKIRDFDEGLRNSDLQKMEELIDELQAVSPSLIKKIYYSFDEFYRIETPTAILSEIILLFQKTVSVAESEPFPRTVVHSGHIRNPQQIDYVKTVFILSHFNEKKLFSRFIRPLANVQLYFTRVEWNQRFYLILILKKNNAALPREDVEFIKRKLIPRIVKNSQIVAE